MIELTLPYPVSANVYWRSFVPRGASRAVTTLSAEAKEYRAKVQRIAMVSGVRPIDGRLHMHLALYPQRPQDWAKRAARAPLTWDDDVRCIDLSNARKVLEDALQGIAYGNDSRIWGESGERMEPDGEARVVVTIRPLVRGVAPQLELLSDGPLPQVQPAPPEPAAVVPPVRLQRRGATVAAIFEAGPQPADLHSPASF